ncbi:CRISPR-associated helicase Cas3' [Streptomonospora wellingtoniae]|uniref:CRISPR-associated helicase Cas3 n=1 Tax=Streptomonospora wellingtoniae TaxID=3075544 RepID=A0ABU2KNI9_9ACTN|nr:CRISPR-associated helicase Cas3' [Streptomonospora sp. DSM 45055]MDT0300830.1 CRISPR-associated helicase Cas3' [Streptomonospora sp. DSM 45055]
MSDDDMPGPCMFAPEQPPIDTRLWGKERGLPGPYPLICHLLDTAAIAGALWDTVLSARARQRIAARMGVNVSAARTLVIFWAGLHDLGKITPPFQAQLPNEYARLQSDVRYSGAEGAHGEPLTHSAATQWTLSAVLPDLGYPATRPLARSLSHQIAQMLGGHHGCFPVALHPRRLAAATSWQPGLGQSGWDEQRRAHTRVLADLTEAHDIPTGALSGEVATVLAGLTVVADWLASQAHTIRARFPASGWSGSRAQLRAHWKQIVADAPGVVSQARLGRARPSPAPFGKQFPRIREPNELQASLDRELPDLVSDDPGLLMITAPTGDGKTEAALFAASVLARRSGAGGLYFALPTMATATAMRQRVRTYVEANIGGNAAMTLLHSMAWLETAPAPEGHEPDDTISDDAATRTAAGEWLRTGKRGILAPLAVGTIDQALSGVLPVRFNVLRLLGLSTKVFIVDEAHAYGPWMHSLLVRLLEWLGALGAPVVLLSATLTGRSASSLVEAYRRGRGLTAPLPVRPRYPGWIYVDGAAQTAPAERQVASSRPRLLEVSTRPVAWDTHQITAPVAAGSRRRALAELLEPDVRAGGCTLVCCTTVEEAQNTHRYLQTVLADLNQRGDLLLLHSRYPAWRRDEITARVEHAFGKPTEDDAPGRRPCGAVLVATSIVEQSLDLDFDHVITDLAALAQLLQRAGRCMRHTRADRAAAMGLRPRLSVLEPADRHDRLSIPRAWGAIHDPGLLARTRRLLHEREGRPVRVPEDVQSLVDAVYSDDFADRLDDAAQRQQQRMLDAQRDAGVLAEQQLAQVTAIPAPADVGDLAKLSNDGATVDDTLVTTRLGADSQRVVCAYTQPDGTLTLDPAGDRRLPRGDLTTAATAEIIAHSMPVPGTWLTGHGDDCEPPASWSRRPSAAALALLRLHPGAEDDRWQCRIGQRVLTMSDIGLHRE